MTDASEDQQGIVSIGGRTITKFLFADEIDGLAVEEEELANVVGCLDKATTAYGMEFSAEMTKPMTKNTSGINTEIKVNGQKIETVTSFKYLGSVMTDEGCKPEILFRIAQATSALTRLKPVLNDRSASVSPKIGLMRSLVTSIFLYACESLTLTAELHRRIHAIHGNEVLPQGITQLLQRPCYQYRSLCLDPAGNRTTRRSPDHRKETQIAVV